ncbi:hypothetical protein [Thiomicrorhabdus indica]|uniref:hypothetical protein n=1 Tax=Thiomicrorhabdus indica TaxID=2267253 RepID=UPI002AA6017A|nr:hypothetical protein [Thiomicrorhabdus indica]
MKNPTVIIDLHNPENLNKLTESILSILNLSYPMALPYLLNQPEAKNNYVAVQSWLNEFLKESDWMESEEILHKQKFGLFCAKVGRNPCFTYLEFIQCINKITPNF